MDIEGNVIGQLIAAIIAFIIVAIPFQKIFARAGFSRAWVIMLLIPYFGVFFCWLLLAARRWPVNRRHEWEPSQSGTG